MFNKIWARYRPIIRKVYICILFPLRLFRNNIYDYCRFFRYSNCFENMKDSNKRNYHVMFIYHGLEKSMSYQKRRKGAGWRNAEILYRLLNVSLTNPPLGYHDVAAFQILEKFVNLPENIDDPKSLKIISFLAINKQLVNEYEKLHGVLHYSLDNFNEGLLDSPEQFFFSRYTLREFDTTIVPQSILDRAIKISMKTPSVCNRQPWQVYHTSEPEIKKLALSFQNGNKPFGEKIPNLLIVSVDLNAFHSVGERYQGWIDGGMYIMSLTYILHSLGIASCILNWSQTAYVDKAIRKKLNISSNENIIAFMGIGYPNQDNLVCESKRKNHEQILKDLRERND